MTVPPLSQRRKPGLSETLPHPRHPSACQSCGSTADTKRWEECDEWDKRSGVLVILCADCSKRLIGPHPRLYHGVHAFEPWPGAMGICVDCRHRDGLVCTHPDRNANGGPGLRIMVPKPTEAHLNFGGGRGCWMKLYPYEPRECAGRAALTSNLSEAG